MTDGKGSGLQFEKVEGSAPAAAAACASCQRTIPDVYFETNGKIFCAQCKETALASLAGGSRAARILKALVFGTIAAAISSVIWYAITTVTGYELGIVAIAVGFAVGIAVRVGSEGRGGWVYQILAVLLTYVAIASSYVPMVMEHMRKVEAEDEARREDERRTTGSDEPAMDADAREGVVLVTSVLFAMTLPVLQVMDGGVIGLLIVCFALYQAFKMNTRATFAFAGPYRVDAAAPPGVT
jgi:hypothetical protein